MRVTCRESARVFPSALGERNVSRFLFSFSFSLSFTLSSLMALCLFLFSSTPDAANCALLDEILVPSAPRLVLQLALPPPPLPLLPPATNPSSSKKTRSLHGRFIRPSEEKHEFFIFAGCSYYCSGIELMITHCSTDKIPRKNRRIVSEKEICKIVKNWWVIWDACRQVNSPDNVMERPFRSLTFI